MTRVLTPAGKIRLLKIQGSIAARSAKYVADDGPFCLPRDLVDRFSLSQTFVTHWCDSLHKLGTNREPSHARLNVRKVQLMNGPNLVVLYSGLAAYLRHWNPAWEDAEGMALALCVVASNHRVNGTGQRTQIARIAKRALDAAALEQRT